MHLADSRGAASPAVQAKFNHTAEYIQATFASKSSSSKQSAEVVVGRKTSTTTSSIKHTKVQNQNHLSKLTRKTCSFEIKRIQTQASVYLKDSKVIEVQQHTL